ncbi:MAG: response regulator, partial [Chitinophagaceae bacterium]
MSTFDVLVVDDDRSFHWVFNQALKGTKKCGHISNCLSGNEVIEFLADYGREAASLPDIIFLDLNMPGINGWAFLQRFQILEKSFTKTIRVYVVSSSDNIEDRHYC